MKIEGDITEVSLGDPQPGFCERFSLGCLGERVHLRASNNNLEMDVKPSRAIGRALLTEKVGQVNVGTVCIVVPWNVGLRGSGSRLLMRVHSATVWLVALRTSSVRLISKISYRGVATNQDRKR